MKRNLAIFIILTQVLSGACAKVDNGGSKEEEENTGVVSNEPFSLTVATCNVLKPSGRRDEMSLESPIVAKSLARSIIDTKADIIGFNELDCNLRRPLTVTAEVRKQNGTKTPITQTWYVDHGFQLKQINERLTATIEGSSWWHSFGKAKTYGQTVQNSALLQNIANGEMQRAYGNGVMASKPILSSQTKSLGNGGNSDEEVRCVTVLETEDCVFASVHMGGVHGDATMRVNVIKNQAEIMTNWFIQKFNNYSKPVFVCGDFNAYPNEIPEIMSSSHWTLLSRTDTPTHSGGNCLDYIFSFKHAAQVNIESSKVIQSVGTNVAPHGIGTVSDHVPILVKVSLVL